MAEGREVLDSRELTIDRPVDRSVDSSDIIVPVENLLKHYGGHTQLRIIANAGLQDSESTNFIVDASNLFASVYDNLNIAFQDEGYKDRLSELSKKYKDYPELMKHFSNWCESRKEMISITKSAAEDLDQQLFIINIARMIGAVVEILNSLNFDIYQTFCSGIGSFANNISPKLGFIMESALKLAPHLRFMGFVSSFYDNLRSQMKISQVVNAMKKDKDMFSSVQEWFKETKELDDSVQKLFPYGINKEIAKSIDNALEDLKEEAMIYTATVLSNLMEEPQILQNGKFLAEVFLFSKSDPAKEWFNRIITGACAVGLECDMFFPQTRLQQLEGTFTDSASKLEIGKFAVNQLENTIKNNIRSNFGRLFICSMSGMSIYCSYLNIRNGTKHKYSDTLRVLSTEAQTFLNSMEKIRFQHL